MNIADKEISRLLREVADRIDAGTTDASEEQTIELAKIFLHEPISKERAAIELKISPSRFDALVADGKIPKGIKIIGWKELRWYMDDILEAGEKYKIGRFK